MLPNSIRLSNNKQEATRVTHLHTIMALAEAQWLATQPGADLATIFAQAVAHAIAASAALPSLPVIGWDITLTRNGPVLLEANTSLPWSLMHLRQLLNHHLSPTPFKNG